MMAEGVPTNNQRGRRSGPCRSWKTDYDTDLGTWDHSYFSATVRNMGRVNVIIEISMGAGDHAQGTLNMVYILFNNFSRVSFLPIIFMRSHKCSLNCATYLLTSSWVHGTLNTMDK